MKFFTTVDNFVNAISGVLYQPFIVPLFLVAAGLIFTIATKGIQIRLFAESIKVITEKPKDGGISSFGALMVSTASRVGTGNIVGVSTALCFGGVGALFWMWITAILGGASAFIESTLAQIYKKQDDLDGNCYGGPSYYMQTALRKRWLGIILAIIIIGTYAIGYNMLAANNLQLAFAGFSFYSDNTPKIIGLILAVLFGLVIFGGGKRLTKITGILVPVMGNPRI